MGRRNTLVIVLLLGAASAGARSAPASSPLGLTVRHGVVLRQGKPFRGIGVNYFDAVFRHLKDPKDTSYERGFRELSAAGIPFARVMGCGFWPSEQRLYGEDRAEFFRRFDGVRSAERNGTGLIPSLFWMYSTVPDLVGEPVSAWGDPKSRTQATMREYVRDVVTRYRGSPAIWGWEFGNEYSLAASLPNAAEHRPPVVPDLGTPRSRSAADDLTYPMLRTAIAAFAREVRRYDRDRLIVSGNGFPRESAWHNWRERSWTKDTPEQWESMLLGDNPDPVDTLSVHAYEEDLGRITLAASAAVRAGKPLFVGEFGAPGPPEKSEKPFTRLLEEIERARVPLAAVWVYDYGAQDTFTVTAENARAYQLRAIAHANERLRAATTSSDHGGQ